MGVRSLTVLMWKHGMVRFRRYFHTTVELAAPLLFYALVFAFKDEFMPPSKAHNVTNMIQETDSIELKDTVAPWRVLYYPDTPQTSVLMDKVGQRLGLKRINYAPDERSKGYYGLSNDSLLSSYMFQLSKKEALVIFHDMDGAELPKKLNYTIRLHEDFQTDSYSTEYDMLGTHSEFGRKYETFMHLQWAIDTSFISMLTDYELPQRVLLQEFPYYRTNRNQVVFILGTVLIPLTWISLMIMFVSLMSRLLEERSTGIQELIKMVGVSVRTLCVSHYLNVVPIGLVFSIGGTILLKMSSNPLLPKSDGFLIFLMLFLYFTSVASMAFVCSHIARDTQYTASLSVFASVVLWLPQSFLEGVKLRRAVRTMTGLLPHAPMSSFWTELGTLEMYGTGMNFTTMWTHHSEFSFPGYLSYFFLLVQIAGFSFLAWYLSHVRPGKYGQALPWGFLCQRNKNEVKPETDEEEQIVPRDPRYFEKPPDNMEVGIRVANITKVFAQNIALKNVSMEVYKGEITVLLGHNGAGKTTLMSIITGMISPTEGKVYVNGKDMETSMSEVRRSLGLCPQHNLFFPDLTVQEHIMFFTMLKQGSYKEAKQSSVKLAQRLGIADKLKALCGVLSGGMKRRVQLACALAGGADLLILDEPTSGLDVETRRDLWDLLLSLRGQRTVLLSTHFMEEADALGDRVAALHGGELRCHATTMSLKRAIGTGYRISFTTVGYPKEAEITNAVTSHIPEATVKEKTINSISFNLPAAASDKFPQLFTALESHRSELGIDTIGVGVSTLEEVFLKLCSDVDTAVSEDEVDTAVIEPTRERLTGVRLYATQFAALIKRQMLYKMNKKWSFLILEIIIPLIIICATTEHFTEKNESREETNRPLLMDLRMYDPMPDKRVMYNLDDGAVLRTVNMEYPGVKFEPVDNVTHAILRSGMRDVFEYNKYIAGIELNNTDAKVMFTTTLRHAAPVALNLLANMLAARHIPWADVTTIGTVNHPFDTERSLSTIYVQPKSMMNAAVWALVVTFIVMATQSNQVSLVCKERQSGTRHIHIMCGCPAELYWLSTLVSHLVLSAVTLFLIIVVAILALESDQTLNNATFVGVILVVLLVGSMAFFAMMYLVSFFFGEKTAGLVIVPLITIFGIITPAALSVTKTISTEAKGISHVLLSLSHYVMPPHTYVFTVARAVALARINAFCRLNKDQCPYLNATEFVNMDRCCAGQQPVCYFCFEKLSLGNNIITLLGQCIVYMTMVVLTQRGFFCYFWDRVFNCKYQPTETQETSDMVRAEKAYVGHAINLPNNQIPDAMLVDNLHKVYPRIIRPSCYAVQGVSFSVKKGECFGLLGVNGAGKSTTFKMLTSEECPTKGRIYANGQHLKLFNSKYLQTLGYCPQFFGLDDFLTGKQNLTLLLTLRGHSIDDVREEVTSWITIVGLAKYADRKVSAYSGGCVRRLGAAAGLSVGAELTMLDEPTAGVDVSARRRVWAALRRGLRNKRSVIITSHSMDEMEALCGRIGIMCSGRLRALGSAAELRAAHAAGHAVIFKLRPTPTSDDVDGAKSQTMQLKSKLHESFNCTLKDEHKTMLHYHINETMRYSDLFKELEKLKREYSNLLEDYSVTETTLEEVFLSFAKAPGLTNSQTGIHSV